TVSVQASDQDHLTKSDMSFVRKSLRVPLPRVAELAKDKDTSFNIQSSRSSAIMTFLEFPPHFNDWDAALLQTFDLAVHDFDRFFSELEFVIDLDSIQRYSKSLVE
ncbi:hypothetical protein Tco_0593486, partial [Tanacetum coccineum]